MTLTCGIGNYLLDTVCDPAYPFANFGAARQPGRASRRKALAGKKKFNVLIVRPSSDDTIQFNIPQLVVWLIGIISICGLFLFGFLVLQYNQSQNATAQLQALEQENAFLQSRLAGMKSSMATLGQYLNEVEHTEKKIRMVFGIPEIDPAERALGIGGFPSMSDSMLNAYQRLSFNTEADLAMLLRKTRFERENFGDILAQLNDRKDQLDHTPSIMPTRGYFSSSFGMRDHPITGVRTMHRGVDFCAPTGTPIYAPADGRVVRVEFHRDLGLTMVIDHGYNIQTRYGHLSKAKLKEGQKVKRGEIIALTGESGYSVTGPHLHYEVHVNGRPVNPMKYIYDMSASQASL
jgi:murein DD-endopeptidase MepM/ murein hydrolase activator NlpD